MNFYFAYLLKFFSRHLTFFPWRYGKVNGAVCDQNTVEQEIKPNSSPLCYSFQFSERENDGGAGFGTFLTIPDPPLQTPYNIRPPHSKPSHIKPPISGPLPYQAPPHQAPIPISNPPFYAHHSKPRRSI